MPQYRNELGLPALMPIVLKKASISSEARKSETDRQTFTDLSRNRRSIPNEAAAALVAVNFLFSPSPVLYIVFHVFAYRRGSGVRDFNFGKWFTFQSLGGINIERWE